MTRRVLGSGMCSPYGCSLGTTKPHQHSDRQRERGVEYPITKPMRLEMDHQTSFTVSFLAGCITVIFITFLIYRYNVTAYEQGYTQKQLQNSQMTIWVKE